MTSGLTSSCSKQMTTSDRLEWVRARRDSLCVAVETSSEAKLFREAQALFDAAQKKLNKGYKADETSLKKRLDQGYKECEDIAFSIATKNKAHLSDDSKAYAQLFSRCFRAAEAFFKMPEHQEIKELSRQEALLEKALEDEAFDLCE